MPTETAAEPPTPEPVVEPTPAKPPLPMPTAGSLFRQFVQLLVLILSLLLIVRTVFIEPFGVPTGSMAPAIYGNHRSVFCPHCDFPIVVGSDRRKRGGGDIEEVYCPNCWRGPLTLPADLRDILGDRLLVDKSVFTLRPPRRWEVAVFYVQEPTKGESPEFYQRALGTPGEPYVKRVVGLPGETIQLHDGDVYANGQLCRKTLAQVRQTVMPVFDMNYVPDGDAGWSARWVTEAAVADPKLPPAPQPATAKGTASVEGSTLTLDAATSPTTSIALGYRHRDLKTGKDETVSDRLGYNGDRKPQKAVHDFAIRCEVEATAGTSGMFAVRLTDGADFVTLELPIAEATVTPPDPAEIAHDGGSAPRTIPGVKVISGKKHRLEFAFVDRRASAALDGVELGFLDLPVVPVPTARRGDVAGVRNGTAKPLQLAVRGATVAVSGLVLSRDIHHYADADSQHRNYRPHTLGSDEFFLLGDNADSSNDSRWWRNPGVPRGAFIGKPFFVHQPLRAGRVTVNGNDRQFTTVDWDRMRLME